MYRTNGISYRTILTMTIYNQINEFLKGDFGQIVTGTEIKNGLKLKYGTKPGSVIPSDYCYNRINDGIRFNKHIFQYIGRNRYKYLGEKYPYTGKIFHKPAGQDYELIVGEWNKGKKVIFDKPLKNN